MNLLILAGFFLVAILCAWSGSASQLSQRDKRKMGVRL